MRENLSWYNLEEDTDSKKAYAILYWEKQGKDVKGLSRVDANFSTVGAVAHMTMLRGISLSDLHLIWLDNRYRELCSMIRPEKEKVEIAKPEIIDKTPELIGEIEGALDDWLTPFDVKSFLAKNQVKPVQANRIAQSFIKLQKELAEVPNDEQLTESYSHLGKRDLKRLADMVTDIVSTCSSYAKATKARAPTRKVKQKPPVVLVKNVVLLRDIVELGLRSVGADKIVGADEAWFYDSEKRRLIKYQSQTGTKLTVKGKAIQNFDPDLSGSKIIRKPDEQLKGANDWTKRPANAIMNGIKASFTKVSGRINDKMLLIGAY
jgi:hypothetical protein